MKLLKCPFCEREFDAYLMYRHFAVAHCDKIEQVITMMESMNKMIECKYCKGEFRIEM